MIDFPRARVLAYLEEISVDLSIIYLEHVIHEFGDETPEFHNRLVGAYLSKVQQERDKKEDHGMYIIV